MPTEPKVAKRRGRSDLNTSDYNSLVDLLLESGCNYTHQGHSRLQITLQELRPSKSETPILLLVPRARYHKIRLGLAALAGQLLRKLGIQRFLLVCIAALLEDLDQDEFVRALDPQIRVFHDELVGFVLGYDLVCISVVQAVI